MTIHHDSPYLAALRGENPSRVPVWFMRQAGRYLPEYRALRADHTFETMLHTPELVAEVTLQPVRRHDVDAAIFFSDILVLPEALGMELHYIEGRGPVFGEPFRRPEQLRPFERGAVEFLAAAMRATVAASPVPVIGFAGTPWTVALYITEGEHGRDFLQARRLLRADPARFGAILDAVADATIEYLAVQLDAGASAIQLFDSWGGLLDRDEHLAVAHARTERVIAALHERYPGVPVVLFSRGTGAYLPAILARSAADAINPDWTVDLAALRQHPACPAAVQGNLDPSLLFAGDDVIAAAVRDHVARVGTRGLVLNTGHGLNPELDPDRVTAAVEAAHAIEVAAP